MASFDKIFTDFYGHRLDFMSTKCYYISTNSKSFDSAFIYVSVLCEHRSKAIGIKKRIETAILIVRFNPFFSFREKGTGTSVPTANAKGGQAPPSPKKIKASHIFLLGFPVPS